MKASRFLKLLGLLRMSRLSQHLERINDRFFTEVLSDLAQIVVLIFAIVWLNHLLACLWYAIAKLNFSDTGVHWIDTQVDVGSFQEHLQIPRVMKTSPRPQPHGFFSSPPQVFSLRFRINALLLKVGVSCDFGVVS